MTFSSQIRRIAPIAGVACLMLAGPAAARARSTTGPTTRARSS